LIFVGIGLVVIGIVVFTVLSSTKGAHLELKGQVIKARTGALDDTHSIAILDFRVNNPSDIPFVVRQVWVTVEKSDGEKLRGDMVSKMDLSQVFQYNKFLGVQYNDALSIKDEVQPHGQIDRMVAASFPLSQANLENAKTIDLWVQDMDGIEFDTVYKMK
jgi:hypothetical protein